jgi:membrane-associated protein
MNLLDMVLHVDRSLAVVFQEWGWAAWALVFLIVFVETGVVVFPFLPGDSLLFACGAFAAAQNQNLALFLVLVAIAAVVGNTVNWFIGLKFGQALLAPKPGKKPLIPAEDLERTHRFFERWGGWAVTIGRFLPIIRTLTPFVAGLGRMSFGKFSLYNILGGVAWTVIFILAGFFFGNLPWVKQNFSLMVLALIVIPGIPALLTVILRWLKKRK